MAKRKVWLLAGLLVLGAAGALWKLWEEAPLAPLSESQPSTVPLPAEGQPAPLERLLARLGPFDFGFSRQVEHIGGDHPIVAHELITWNRQEGRRVSWVQWFPESAIARAFIHSPLVAAAAAESELKLPDQGGLEGLETFLRGQELRFSYGEDCETAPLQSFSREQFVAVDGNLEEGWLALHLPLENFSGHCNGELPRLRLQLPIPEPLKELVRQAKAGEHGNFFGPMESWKVCDTCSPPEVTGAYFGGG